eukprot:g7213.t1
MRFLFLHISDCARGQLAPGCRVSVSTLLHSDPDLAARGQLAPGSRVSVSMLLHSGPACGQLARWWSGGLPLHCSLSHWLSRDQGEVLGVQIADVARGGQVLLVVSDRVRSDLLACEGAVGLPQTRAQVLGQRLLQLADKLVDLVSLSWDNEPNSDNT